MATKGLLYQQHRGANDEKQSIKKKMAIDFNTKCFSKLNVVQLGFAHFKILLQNYGQAAEA